MRDLLPNASIEDAYAVQDLNTQLAVSGGARLVGWKIGLTSPAVQAQLGVDQPDFGALLAHSFSGDDLEIDGEDLLQPRVEAEVAFVLERDLPRGPVTAGDVLLAAAFVLPAIEIVDSRIEGWDITIIDTVADNASSGRVVLGPSPVPLDRIDLAGVTMEMSDGDRTVSSGTGAACLGHPMNAVVWLANTLDTIGQPLRAGQIVLSGALGPMHSVEAGRLYTADISGLGSVRARFAGP